MLSVKTKTFRLALNALYSSAVYRLLQSRSSGVGLIFTLHRVHDDTPQPFNPNRILSVTPDFLEQTIQVVRQSGYDIVSLDEAKRRLIDAQFRRKFACFTLDDGYLDNFTHALPIFERHSVPFTIYVSTSFPDQTAFLWWQHLEEVIAERDELWFQLGHESRHYTTRDLREKYTAYNDIYWILRSLPHDRQMTCLEMFVRDHEIQSDAICRQVSMSWDQLRILSHSKLATLGAHTVNHYALSKLTDRDVCQEVTESQRIIYEKTGVQPRHFAYPFGDRGSAAAREFAIVKELGFDTATTGRKGVLFPQHAAHLHALPRVSLNGDFQESRYVRLYLSGAPFALFNKFKRLDVL